MVNHHLISPDTEEIIHAVPTLAPYREVIGGRATLCWKTAVFPVECVVRGYLSRSAWKEYSKRLLQSCPRNCVRRQAGATRMRFDGLRSLVKRLPMGARSRSHGSGSGRPRLVGRARWRLRQRFS